MLSWNESDTEASAFLRSLDAAAFHERILVADARSVAFVERAALAAALPARRAAFAAAGVGEPRLTRAAGLPLDEQHLLVTGTWDAAPVELASSYLVRRTPEGLRAIAYVNHHGLGSAT